MANTVIKMPTIGAKNNGSGTDCCATHIANGYNSSVSTDELISRFGWMFPTRFRYKPGVTQISRNQNYPIIM